MVVAGSVVAVGSVVGVDEDMSEWVVYSQKDGQTEKKQIFSVITRQGCNRGASAES